MQKQVRKLILLHVRGDFSNNIGTGILRAQEIPVNLPADVPVVQEAIIKDGISGVG
jgi:hypothetical protein